jgi:uncharacterized protein
MTTLPPLHLWNPPFCGNIDMRIAANGTWYYQGTPINRPAMVKLFASILRHTSKGYELVTPVERVGIQVEDAPFIATTMQIIGKNQNQQLKFTTNIGDEMVASTNNPIRFERQPNDAYIPYCLVREGLWAKLTRSLYTELVDIGEIHETQFGVWSAGIFFGMVDANELEQNSA